MIRNDVQLEWGDSSSSCGLVALPVVGWMWQWWRRDGCGQFIGNNDRHRWRDRGIDFDLTEFNHGNAVRHAAVHGFGYGSVQHGSFLGGEWCGGRQYRDRNHYRERPVYGEHARNVHGDGNFDL